MRISVVIPAYNEEGNIGRLVEETFAVVPEPSLHEVIIVDDASDGTGAEVKALFKSRPSLRYLRHGRRAGQSAALRTGVMAASAPVIATMDGDGQNDPKDIMRLFVKLGAQGKEPAMVAGLREGRKAKGALLLAYAIYRMDPVFILGQAAGLVIYARNIYFIWLGKRANGAAEIV
jgi:dolichol-phosphate mannosyltransferase